MSTLEKVRNIVASQLKREADEFSAATVLVEEGYESLDVIETVFALEEEFDISINFNANDGADFATIGDIVKAVDAELAKKGAR